MRTSSELAVAFGRTRIARAEHLAAAGLGRHDLRCALRAGAVVRLRRGVYALPGTAADRCVAAQHGGMLACVSAARAAGLWVLDDGRLHVAVADHGRVHPHATCRCRTHRGADVTLGGRTSVLRSLIQILVCLGEEAFFVSLESALRQRKIPMRRMAALRRALPARARRLVDLARADADSGLESLLRLRLFDDGIRLRSQVTILGVGRVDFVLGDRLILEVDGRANHDGSTLRHKDLMRDAAAAALGFETLRFDYAMIVHEWELVRAAILAKIDAGSHLSR